MSIRLSVVIPVLNDAVGLRSLLAQLKKLVPEVEVIVVDGGSTDDSRVVARQDVVVTFDALPEQAFAGQVTRIYPMAEPGSGGVRYTLIVEVEDLDPVLRWGMTAFVDIQVDDE